MIRFFLFWSLTAVYALLLGWPVHWLWNQVGPQLFHLPPIGFLQGVALVAISRLLFGIRIAGFLLWTFVLSVCLGWLGQWLWNQVGPQLFHLPAVSWWQAGVLVALFQILFGAAHHWKRSNGLGIWWSGRWRSPHAWEEHFEDHARMHKEEWRLFRRGMRRMGREAREEGRRWKERVDEAAPAGSHRNWKHFEAYWREKGKADFEAWLDRSRKGE